MTPPPAARRAPRPGEDAGVAGAAHLAIVCPGRGPPVFIVKRRARPTKLQPRHRKPVLLWEAHKRRVTAPGGPGQ
jgi:hypothetical protein